MIHRHRVLHINLKFLLKQQIKRQVKKNCTKIPNQQMAFLSRNKLRAAIIIAPRLEIKNIVNKTIMLVDHIRILKAVVILLVKSKVRIRVTKVA